MLVKTFIHPAVTKYLKETVTEFYTNPHSGVKQPRYYVTFDNGDKYLLDVYEPTNELVAVYSMEQLDDATLGSMEDELDTMGEYVELCAKIERHLLKQYKLHKLSSVKPAVLNASFGDKPTLTSESLLAFINKLNENYLKGLSK
jgi:hypothetical protein